MESIFLVAAVVGATELINEAFKANWKCVVKITAASAIGITAGLLGIDGLTPTTGLVGGLAASGAVTVADHVGKKRIN